MKKRKLRTTSHRFGVVVSILLLLVATVTSCSKEEAVDRLPDGEYPMNFTASVEGQTATRATSANSWDGTEQVAIQLGSEVKKYVAATSGVLSVANGGDPFYWQSTANITVTAWHPYSDDRPTSFTVLANQIGEGYQQSDLIYASQSVTFAEKKLAFKHLPAKVVVNLKNGDGVTEAEVQSATVSIVNQNLTSGTIADDWSVVQTSGNVSITPKSISTASDAQKSVQALVVPQQMQNQKFIKVTIGVNDYFYTPTNNDANFEVGKQYTYNITVQKNGLTVTASGATEWTGTTSGVASYVKFSNDELKIGDYYYSDGTTSDGGLRKLYTDGTFVKEDIDPNEDNTVIGIVLKVGRDADGDWKDDCEYKQKNSSTPMYNIQGYVLALYDANDANSVTWSWGNYSTQVTHDDMNREKETGFYGYKNTNAIKAFAADQKLNFAYAFPAAYNASEDYEGRYSAPDNSSGWFFPSAGQCKYWLNNRDVLLESVRKATGNGGYNWQRWYWSSSENSSNLDLAWYLRFDNGYMDTYAKDYNRHVRSVLAF